MLFLFLYFEKRYFLIAMKIFALRGNRNWLTFMI